MSNIHKGANIVQKLQNKSTALVLVAELCISDHFLYLFAAKTLNTSELRNNKTFIKSQYPIPYLK